MTTIPGRWLAALWIGSAIVTLAMLGHAHEDVSIRRPAAMAVVAAILTAAWVRFELRGAASPRLCAARDLAEHVGLFAAIGLIGTIASYPAAAATTGFADPTLAGIDRLMGFDWGAWYRVVAAHPLLQIAGRGAYESIFVSPAILLAHYALAGRKAAARRFLLAVWIAAVLTLLLFPYFVAIGPLAYAWRGPIPYMPASALYQMQLIPALRSHAAGPVDAAALRGLVEAPSFHTTSGVLYMAFAWREARLRWPLAILNLAMLLATPVEGTHYLIDMILGAGVAVAALAAARLAAEVAGRRAGGMVAVGQGPRARGWIASLRSQ